MAQSLEQFAEEALGGVPATSELHRDIEHVPVLMYRPPEIVVLAVHGKRDLVQVVPLIPRFGCQGRRVLA